MSYSIKEDRKEERFAAALARLGVTREKLQLAAPISSQLQMAAKKLRRRGLPTSPYYYLKCSTHLDARKIVGLYYSLPANQRTLVPIEAYCLAADVDPTSLLDLIARTCATITRQTSALIAAVNQPKVVEKTVEMALTDEGVTDRLTLHRATGFLPTPRGAQTTVNVAASASASAPTLVAAPAPEQITRVLADKLNELRGLPPAPAQVITMPTPDREPLAIEAESDDDSA